MSDPVTLYRGESLIPFMTAFSMEDATAQAAREIAASSDKPVFYCRSSDRLVIVVSPDDKDMWDGLIRIAKEGNGIGNE